MVRVIEDLAGDWRRLDERIALAVRIHHGSANLCVRRFF
jgi:hypothetical protein